MWGSTFADLAKKAQEQASSLAEQAQSMQSPNVGLFNLDSMMQNEEGDGGVIENGDSSERPPSLNKENEEAEVVHHDNKGSVAMNLHEEMERGMSFNDEGGASEAVPKSAAAAASPVLRKEESAGEEDGFVGGRGGGAVPSPAGASPEEEEEAVETGWENDDFFGEDGDAGEEKEVASPATRGKGGEETSPPSASKLAIPGGPSVREEEEADVTPKRAVEVETPTVPEEEKLGNVAQQEKDVQEEEEKALARLGFGRPSIPPAEEEEGFGEAAMEVKEEVSPPSALAKEVKDGLPEPPPEDVPVSTTAVVENVEKKGEHSRENDDDGGDDAPDQIHAPSTPLKAASALSPPAPGTISSVNSLLANTASILDASQIALFPPPGEDEDRSLSSHEDKYDSSMEREINNLDVVSESIGREMMEAKIVEVPSQEKEKAGGWEEEEEGLYDDEEENEKDEEETGAEAPGSEESEAGPPRETMARESSGREKRSDVQAGTIGVPGTGFAETEPRPEPDSDRPEAPPSPPREGTEVVAAASSSAQGVANGLEEVKVLSPTDGVATEEERTISSRDGDAVKTEGKTEGAAQVQPPDVSLVDLHEKEADAETEDEGVEPHAEELRPGPEAPVSAARSMGEANRTASEETAAIGEESGVRDAHRLEASTRGLPTPLASSEGADGARPPPASPAAVETSQDEPPEEPTPVPQFAIEKFMDQMRRLDENHQSEISDLERRYNGEIQNLQTELDSARKKLASVPKNEVVSHDKCLAQMRKMEIEYNGKIKDKEEEMVELRKGKEGLGLKVEVLGREVDGLKKMLEEREKDVGQAKEQQNSQLAQSEKRKAEMDAEMEGKDTQIEELKSALAASNSELESSNDSYATLKSRVKIVATELKERRMECRTLHTSVTDLTEQNSTLQTQLTNLQTQLSSNEESIKSKDEEISNLRSTVTEKETELECLNKSLHEKGAVGEKTLASYKKKAQGALATVNARAAAANQAREEAEMEATAARSAAEEALERAKVAEQSGREAERKAEERVGEMEKLMAERETKMEGLEEELRVRGEELSLVRGEVQEGAMARERLAKEMDRSSEDLRRERDTNDTLTAELRSEQDRTKTLKEEVETLREELQRKASKAFMERQRNPQSGLEGDGLGPSSGGDVAGEGGAMSGVGGGAAGSASAPPQQSESDGTIVMLQQELQGANEAIRELKEALRGALLQRAASDGTERDGEQAALLLGGGLVDLNGHSAAAPNDGTTASAQPILMTRISSDSEDIPSSVSEPPATKEATAPPSTNDSTPLFFAMEKQAELNTARDEITRLANLLGDAESAKMEAYDAMEDMRRKMEEAEARLRRYEKLGLGPEEQRREQEEERRRRQHAAQHSGTSSPDNYFAPARGGFGASSSAVSRNGPLDQYAGVGGGESPLRRGSGTISLGSHDSDNESSPSYAIAGGGVIAATPPPHLGNDKNVNLEYLKNVMLSYLNAKTVNERKALVPVVSAVLCLTAEEQAHAMKSVEESGGFEAVGNSLFESLGSKVHRLL